MADETPIVIKKVKKGGGHGHHGGAWKVAYADFVTAMMAFFLLMWLINTTTPEQKRGIADYFAPASVSRTTSGAGGIMGGTAFGDEGARRDGASSQVMEMSPPADANRDGDDNAASGESESEATENQAAKTAARENLAFDQAEQSLRQAMQDLPDLSHLSKHVLIDQTPEGLRIQLVDQEGRPMFAPGSADPLPRTQRLMEEVARIVERLPNRVTISGHTDGQPFESANGDTNWELSAARANAARRLLMAEGLAGDRIYQVSGKAGSEPLLPDDPFASANRRISIILLREAPPLPPGHEP